MSSTTVTIRCFSVSHDSFKLYVIPRRDFCIVCPGIGQSWFRSSWHLSLSKMLFNIKHDTACLCMRYICASYSTETRLLEIRKTLYLERQYLCRRRHNGCHTYNMRRPRQRLGYTKCWIQDLCKYLLMFTSKLSGRRLQHSSDLVP